MFAKRVKEGARTLFSAAFRNGSGKVNTCVSSIHRDHHWEGTALIPSEAVAYYDKDNRSRWNEILKANEFARVDNAKLNIRYLSEIEVAEEEDSIMETHLYRNVRPITLRQGTSDWHVLRKLSLTSSQGHEAIKALLPEYGNDENLTKVMKYLEGPDWAMEGGGDDGGGDDGGDDGTGGDDAGGDDAGDDGNGGENEMNSLNEYVNSFTNVSISFCIFYLCSIRNLKHILHLPSSSSLSHSSRIPKRMATLESSRPFVG